MILEAFFWMVINVHHEARGESLVGQIAVNHVVLNRAKYGSGSVKKEILKKAAFSWTNNKNKKIEALALEKTFCNGVENLDINRLRKFKKYGSSMIAVTLSLFTKDMTYGSNHYYNPRIAFPKWANSGYSVSIGNHDFHTLQYGRFKPNNEEYAIVFPIRIKRRM